MRQRSPEEKALLEKEKEQRQERQKVIQLLRNVSIRLPLLIYGADVDFTESIHMKDFIALVDDESWKEFMPVGVTKALFGKMIKFYDEDVVVGAGFRIRHLAKAADEMPPTKRVQRVAEIIGLFRNPDKETVLTPWRVVNMHLSDMLGGYCFFDETFDARDGLLDEPREVDHGEVTETVFRNSQAKILEINSKSGLYPLYAAYSLYASQLPKDRQENSIPIEETQDLWNKVVARQIFVLCKTKMARQITRRTLVGYKKWNVNAVYLPRLMDRMSDKQRLSNKLRNPTTWGRKEGEKMRFDLVIGNPPYQEVGGSGGTNDAPIYQHFAVVAEILQSKYVSFIMPARWFSGGREALLKDFRDHMLKDGHLSKLCVYPEARDIFPTVEIKAGLCYYLQDSKHAENCEYSLVENGDRMISERNLSEVDILIRNPILASIVQTVRQHDPSALMVDSIISGDTPFGIGTKPQDSKKYAINIFEKPAKTHDTLLLYYEKGERKIAYVDRTQIRKNNQDIDSFKVFVPKAGGSGNDPYVLGNPEMYPPNSVCSQTFVYASFKNKLEAINFIAYLKTKFFRILVSAVKITQDALSSVYRFVPMQDYSFQWTDEMLYKKYGLSQEQIDYIESTIKPMN